MTLDLPHLIALGNAATAGPWGVSKYFGDMVVTPPPDEALRRIEVGEMPFTSKRIANCENDTYLTPDEVRANALFIAEVRNAFPAIIAELEECERLRKENAELRKLNNYYFKRLDLPSRFENEEGT